MFQAVSDGAHEAQVVGQDERLAKKKETPLSRNQVLRKIPHWKCAAGKNLTLVTAVCDSRQKSFNMTQGTSCECRIERIGIEIGEIDGGGGPFAGFRGPCPASKNLQQ